jgi:aquaporin Z
MKGGPEGFYRLSMRRLAAELLGTFMLVAAVLGGAVVSGNAAGIGVALAVGLSVMAMIYAVGPISGGHFNPAVTVGMTVAGRFDPKDILPYVLAQLAGGILAALFFLIILTGKPDFVAQGYASTGYGEHSAGGFTLLGAFLGEVVFTAVFVLIIARVTRPIGGAGIMAPVAIGLALTAMHLISIPISNTSLNPARSTATALFADRWALQQLWLFWVAPLAGGAIGGFLDRYFGETP